MNLKEISIAAVSVALASTSYGQTDLAPRIAWYAQLQPGLQEAQRSGRPILFVSAAPKCLGVSGIW